MQVGQNQGEQHPGLAGVPAVTISSYQAPETGLDPEELEKVISGKGSGKHGKLIAKDAANILNKIPSFIAAHTPLFLGIVASAINLGSATWERVWDAAKAVMLPVVQRGAHTTFYNEGERIYRTIVTQNAGDHFGQRKTSALGLLTLAGDHSNKVLEILQYMVRAKEAKEAEHMMRRRQKLADDASKGGDEAAKAAWLDASQTTDKQVREEVVRVHESYLPILDQLQKRSKDKNAMEGLSDAEQRRLEKAKTWAGEDLSMLYNTDVEFETTDTNTRNSEYH